MSPTGADLSKLDADAVRATQRLISRGFEAYLVGGCVRDLLLGRAPKDYDIATEARPPQVKRTFPRNSRIIGRRFKLAHLHFNNNTKILEVSTFRTSPPAESGAGEADLLIVRDNEFGTAEEDALRRDFTVNALFLDPTRDLILDYSNGLADLQARVIRTIGDPRVRFREDPVRILRAAKFAGRLGFSIEPETFAAMAETSGDLVRSAPPRLLEEILRLLRGGHALDSFQLLRDVGALKCLVPVLAEFLATARHEQRVDFWRLLEALDHRIQDTGHVPQNAVLLGVLLVCPVLAKAAANPGRSPSSIAEELLGPLSMSLRLPRRDAGCLKRICGVQHRFLQADETKRFRIEGFVHGPYFDEAFELFDLRMLASGDGHDLIDRWHELAGTLGHRAAAEGAFADGETVDHEHDEERGDFTGRGEAGGEAETDDGAGPAATTDDAAPHEADGEADTDADHGTAAHVETHDDRRPWRRARTTPPAIEAVQTPAEDAGAAPERGAADEPNGDDTAPQGDGGNRRRRRRRRRGRGRDDERSEPGDAPRSEAASASGPTADPIPSDDHPGDDAASPRPAALPPRRAVRADFVHPEGAALDDEAVLPDAPSEDAAEAPEGSDEAAGEDHGEPRPEGEPGRRRRRRRRRRGNRHGDQHEGDRFPASPAPAPHGEAIDAETGHHAPLTSEETQPDPDAPLPDGAAADAGPDVDLDDGSEVTIEDGDTTAATEPAARDGERRGRRRRRRGRRGQGADGRGHQHGGEEAQGPHPAQADAGEDPATLSEPHHEVDESARVDGATQPPHQHGRPRQEPRHQRGQQQHAQRQHGQQQHGQQRRQGHDRHQQGHGGQGHSGQGHGGQGHGGQGQGGQGQRQQHQQPSQRNDRRGDRQDRRDRRRGGRDGGPPQGSPRDVDVVPRYRDRRGKVDVIEPPPLDLSAFDVELDPKRVPTFGSIVEGKGRPKKRSPRVPEDGIDDYRPPPPPGSDSGPIAPPPPPPSDTPDTFGDW